MTTNELARKRRETPVNGPESFCGIGRGFIAMTIGRGRGEKRLKEIYWTY